MLTLFSIRNTATILIVLVGLMEGFAVPVQGDETSCNVVSFYGYDDCIELKNDVARVVLCPAAGGRVLYYGNEEDSLLYLPPGDEGWTWDGKQGRGKMNAGRFDIGPEKVVARRSTLWQGRWEGRVVGPTKAELTSQPEHNVGVRLIRDFELLPGSTTLHCRQTIVNISEKVVETCHWSRTFLKGKGECVVPLSTFSRFPKHYVRYESGALLNMSPDDSHVQRKGDFLLVTDAPKQPKLGFDSREGWFAYRMKQPYLFVKRFPVYPDRAYNEVAGLTISIWYPQDQMVELEPIGPAERLAPGEQASFTETWNFLPNQQDVPLEDLEDLVQSLAGEK